MPIYACGSLTSTLECLYDCFLDSLFQFYQNKLICILILIQSSRHQYCFIDTAI